MRPMLPFIPGYFYYISLGLQAICVLHCIRKNNQQKWIWIIVFLPLIGCIAYFFTEIVRVRDLNSLPTAFGSMLNSAGRISRLEKTLHFSNTFNNRIMLADAYLAAGRTDEAIELYTTSLTGAFSENEYVIRKLIAAYYMQQRYSELIPLAEKIYTLPEFTRSKAHIQYACSLGLTGHNEEAEKEFKKLKTRFSAFEARYQYGLFLQRMGRKDEALLVFRDMKDEAPHLSARERRYNRAWILKAKEELKRA